MIYSALFLIFFSNMAWSFDKDFTTLNDRVPHEFNLLFDSLKLEIKSPSEKLKMVGLIKDLNDNLGFLEKEHIYMLIKTEVIKGTLEHKFKKVRQIDINALLITRMEDGFKRKKTYLNSFSSWLWQSVIAELNARKDAGVITNTTFNPAILQGLKRTEAYRFKKYLNYLGPWIDLMDSLEAPEFNAFMKDISWEILNRINERSLLFKRFASTSAGATTVTLFNIPQKLLDLKPADIKKMQNNETPLTLKEEAAKEKTEAQTEIDKVTPLDMSTISDDVATELEKKQ